MEELHRGPMFHIGTEGEEEEEMMMMMMMMAAEYYHKCDMNF
jgi:hypothetical protein